MNLDKTKYGYRVGDSVRRENGTHLKGPRMWISIEVVRLDGKRLSDEERVMISEHLTWINKDIVTWLWSTRDDD